MHIYNGGRGEIRYIAANLKPKKFLIRTRAAGEPPQGISKFLINANGPNLY